MAEAGIRARAAAGLWLGLCLFAAGAGLGEERGTERPEPGQVPAPVAVAAPLAERAPGWPEVSAIFEVRCVMCHSAGAGASKGLRLDDYAAVLAGSERGPVLVAGDAEASELVLRLRGTSAPRMPFLGRPLPEEEIAVIARWIAAGLPQSGEGR